MDINSIVSRLCIAALLAAAALGLAGCYAVQAATGQLTLLARRRSVVAVIADPATPAAIRQQLAKVAGMRDFASRELGLPDNASYRGYVDVGRPAVVWNVYATAEFSVEPQRWCYPVVGCVEYRGYFSATQGRAFAARLHRDGYDVAVRSVAAYSTLGLFADPVLSTMLGWSDAELAGILFHELTHQVVYVPGDAPFDEALASLVEQEGVARWLLAQGRSADLATYRQDRERALAVAKLMLATRQRLAALYASAAEREALRAGKAAAFDDLRQQYRRLRSGWGESAADDGRSAADFNNASLVPVATYEQCLPGLRRELDAVQGDLRAFYARAHQLARLTYPQRHAAVCD